MKKTILAISLVACFVLATGLAIAAMPNELCSNLAETKDKIVQKNTSYEYLLSGYLSVDPCTGVYYSDNINSPYYNPTDIYRSHDGNYTPLYERYYFPETGSIRGTILQYGMRGAQKWEYTICADGTAKVMHNSFGWWSSNRNTICNSCDLQ
jgi:hypothetical protein